MGVDDSFLASFLKRDDWCGHAFLVWLGDDLLNIPSGIASSWHVLSL